MARSPLLLGLVWAATMPAGWSAAQSGPPPAPEVIDTRAPVQLVRLDVGWDGVAPAERWSPVVVWLWSRGAFSGTVTLEYRQDATQHARVVLPVATTPGEVVPFELAACLARPSWMGTDVEAKLTINDDASRWYREWRLVTTPADRDELPAPQVVGGWARALVVGECSAASAFVNPAGDPSAFEVGTPLVTPPGAGVQAKRAATPEDRWQNFPASRRGPGDLPLSWMAYDGIDLVIAPSAELDKADPRAREALMEWVHAGGRLILLIEPAGSGWARYIPGEQIPILADEGVPVRIPPGVTAGAGGRAPVEATTSAIPARVIRVTPSGVRNGWKAVWALEEEGASLGAMGPVGMGMVMVLGVDPSRLPRVVSAASDRVLWRDLVLGRSVMVPSYALAPEPADQFGAFYYVGSGPDPSAAAALSGVIDRTLSAAPVSDLAFIGIAVAMLAMAFMVGPGDWLWLRRRGRGRRSWMTALAWIVLASAGAWAAPAMFRSGLTQIDRTVVEDVLGESAAGPALRWRTGVASVFAGTPTRVRLAPAPGSWWRGVSAVSSYQGNGRALTPLNQIADLSQPRGVAPRSMSQAQWTLRCLLEQTPGDRPGPGAPEARVERSGEGWAASIHGLPAGARAQGGLLGLREGYKAVSFAGATSAEGRDAFVCTTGGGGFTVRALDWVPTVEPYSYPQAASETGAVAEFSALCLPGARGRLDAAEARRASGHWAVLIVLVEGLEDQSGLDAPRASRRCRTLFRFLVPLQTPDLPGREGEP